MLITFKNVEDNISLNISLPLISGNVIDFTDGKIYVENVSFKSQSIAWPIVNGSFKILVQLHDGENKICFRHKNNSTYLTLWYKPLAHKKFIRLVYIKCKNADGKFQAPIEEENSINSALKRICLAAQMLQTFTYDKIGDHNLYKKTFKLEEENDHPVCHVFNSVLTLEEAYQMDSEKLWSHFAVEIMNSNLRLGNDCKFLAFLSFTRYNCGESSPKNHREVLSLTKGQVALGGGGLALFGTGCLHTWSQDLQEVPWRFGDNRKVDRMKFMDDSGNRGRKWACYSTGLGATLHELGHTFDLGHTSTGIMGRGFDDIHKYFIIDMFYHSHSFHQEYSPYYKNSDAVAESFISGKCQDKQPIELLKNMHLKNENQNFDSLIGGNFHQKKCFEMLEKPWHAPSPPEEEAVLAVEVGKAHWVRSSALLLYYHKWFNDYEDEEKSPLYFENKTIISPHGIRVVEFRDQEGTAFYHLEFLEGDGNMEMKLPEYGINKVIPVEMSQISFVAQDSQGNILKSNIDLEKLEM